MITKTPLVKFVYNRRHTATGTHEASVELRITYQGKQKYINTGIRVLPRQWRRDSVVNRPDAEIINKTLDELLTEVRKSLLQMQIENVIDINSVAKRMRRSSSSAVSMEEFFKKRAMVRSYGKSEDNQGRHMRFLSFLKDWGGIKDWQDITEEKIIAFDKYLSSKKLQDYSKWNNYHRFLNSFINDAIAEDLLQRNPYKWVKISREKTQGSKEKCLTPREFKRIKKLTPETETLQKTQDLFIFQTYTCLAYIDLSQFYYRKIQTVKGMKVYTGKRSKTKEAFTVPLLPPALEILEKYGNELPIMSNVKYNENLKELAHMAKIKKPLSSHWARHTGATLLLNEGTDMRIVSRICGHSSTRITEQVYAKLLDETVVAAIKAKEKKKRRSKS